MKTYKYWIQVSGLVVIRGVQTEIKCYVGSNYSADEAATKTPEKIRKIQDRINGVRASEDYEIEIREEVVHTIDQLNVVTRNRYGALVLNTASLTILDIDSHKLSFWEKLGFAKKDKKTEILKQLEAHYSNRVINQSEWRVYETKSGFRVIIQNLYLNPADKSFPAVMAAVNCDPIYARMCQRQRCYRARLTPKPYRMNVPTIRYKWPMGEEELIYATEWVSMYERESIRYSVCKYVKTLGAQGIRNPIVEYHDRMCGAFENKPLA